MVTTSADLRLNREDVAGGPVPRAEDHKMLAAPAVDQLGRDPHPVVFALDRAFQHVADVERLAHFSRIDRLASPRNSLGGAGLRRSRL